MPSSGASSGTGSHDNLCPTCVIAQGQVAHARREAAQFAVRATYAEELVVVALRMLKRAGKLKPTTDDEKAAIELCSYLIDLPAANRRLLDPRAEPYSQIAVNIGQQILDLDQDAA